MDTDQVVSHPKSLESDGLRPVAIKPGQDVWKDTVNFSDWESGECFKAFLRLGNRGALGHLGLGADLAETWFSTECFSQAKRV